MLDFKSARFEFVQSLLKPSGTHAVSDGINDPIELAFNIAKFALFGITKGIVFAAMEVNLLMKGSNKFFDELGCHQSLAQSVED